MMTGMLIGGVLALGLAGAPQAADPSVASARAVHDLAKGNVLKAAAQIGEDLYAFKPTADVRSLGALFAHIADGNNLICGAASGEKASAQGIEKSKTTKKDIIAALEESFKFCEAAFAGLTGARANEAVKFFIPGTHTRLGVLAFNNTHVYEHYGNIVTYMRLKGLVPPSSQR